MLAGWSTNILNVGELIIHKYILQYKTKIKRQMWSPEPTLKNGA